MKKLILSLVVISFVTSVVGFILIIYTLNKTAPLTNYLFRLLYPIILILTIPFVLDIFTCLIDDKNSRFAYKKIAITPRAWLTIYSLVLGVSIVLTLIVNQKHILDLPHILNDEYSQTPGANIRITSKIDSKSLERELRIVIERTEYRVIEKAFRQINTEDKYTFYYLPHTKWVVDIVDEEGLSLLMNRQR